MLYVQVVFYWKKNSLVIVNKDVDLVYATSKTNTTTACTATTAEKVPQVAGFSV